MVAAAAAAVASTTQVTHKSLDRAPILLQKTVQSLEENNHR